MGKEGNLELSGDGVLLVGGGDEGGAGGGGGACEREGVVRRQPRVVVEGEPRALRCPWSRASATKSIQSQQSLNN